MIRMVPRAVLRVPAARVMERLRVCLAAEILKGRARMMVRADMESMVPMLNRAMYPMPVRVESMVGRSATMTAALPASPWTTPMAKDLMRNTGLPKMKKLLWRGLARWCDS